MPAPSVGRHRGRLQCAHPAVAQSGMLLRMLRAQRCCLQGVTSIIAGGLVGSVSGRHAHDPDWQRQFGDIASSWTQAAGCQASKVVRNGNSACQPALQVRMSGCTCDAAIVRAPRWGLTSCPCNAARRACPSLSLMLHLTHLHIEPAEACCWAWNHGRCVLISSMLPVTQMRARFWHAFGAHWIGTGQTQFRLTDAATCTERLLNDACQRSTFAVSWDLHHGSALHKFLLMVCDHSGACLPTGPPLVRAIHRLQSLDKNSL